MDLVNASIKELDSWMKLVELVKDNFPGLDSDKDIANYRSTLIKNINRDTALCVKYDNDVVGVLLFSYKSSCLSCMAVHPSHRRRGIASMLVERMLSLFPDNAEISVTTFRENDPLGIASRKLYKRFGFVEAELVMEFDYPFQKYIYKK